MLANQQQFKIAGYYIVPTDTMTLMQALDVGPVSIALDCKADTFNMYKSGIFDGRNTKNVLCNKDEADHVKNFETNFI